MPSFITIDQAAERLGLHPRTVRRMICGGELPAYRVGRFVRIDPDDLSSVVRPVVAGEVRP